MGTELYTAALARGLYERKVPVVVFTTEKNISLPNLSLIEKTVEDVPVVELINNLHFQSFKESWDQPEINRIFGDFLDRFRPTVVHFNHLLYLSIGLVQEAKQRSIPVVFTLHDYWLECPRFGQRIHADGSICHDIEIERCAGCLQSFKYGQTRFEQRLSGWISSIRSRLGLDLGSLARSVGRRLKQGVKEGAPGSEVEDSTSRGELLSALEERDQRLRSEVLPAVDLFLSPSAFLRQELVKWGIAAERIRHLPTGVDLNLFGRGERVERKDKVRVTFLGSRIPVKGPHLLLEAWQRLSPEQKAAAELRIIGPDQHDPDYQGVLQELAARAPAELLPALSREEVSATLYSTDLLVVPSLWFENAPLIILEALAARTPMLVASIGGMAELVEPGASGFHFQTASVEDLARKLAELIDSPGKLDALYSSPPSLPTVRQLHAEIIAIYKQLAVAPQEGGAE